MLVQIHMLQNYAPSNLNRDDTGAPKDAIFGGVRRGRISSQCLKRSIRKSGSFVEAFAERGLLASRTRRLPALIEKELKSRGLDEESIQAIVNKVPLIGRESAKATAATAEDEDKITAQLIFIGLDEVPLLTDQLLASYEAMGAVKWAKAKGDDLAKELQGLTPRSVDVAMFGRMTTSAAFENVEAAVQVAHALSTNALVQEFDYFTAVDDLQTDEPGAGMIGDVEFNSNSYYRYINVHWEGLLDNLGGDVELAKEAVGALLVAATEAQPSGKQNTFAAQNLPDLVLVEVRQQNVAVSYANAFLKPARAGRDGSPTVMEVSAQQLADYRTRLNTMYTAPEASAYAATFEVALDDAENKQSLYALRPWIESLLGEEA